MIRQKFSPLQRILPTILLAFLFGQNSYAGCTGRFVDPISDVCWDCIFPISIGAIEMPPSTTFRPDTENYPSPICVCPKAGIPTGSNISH